MPLPDTYKDALLSMLCQVEDLAYLIVDSEGYIATCSPEAAGYGVLNHIELAHGPEWLAAIQPRLLQLFERPSLLNHTTLDMDRHPISIHAQAFDLEGAPCLLIILRRPGGESHLKQAPYHSATGLYSYAYMESKITEELERMKRFASGFSLLSLDFSPMPEPVSILSDVLRTHFRAIDIVGHAPHQGFLVLLPGTTQEQAQNTGARLAAWLGESHFALPANMMMRYTASEAVATDSCASLSTRLEQTDPQCK